LLFICRTQGAQTIFSESSTEARAEHFASHLCLKVAGFLPLIFARKISSQDTFILYNYAGIAPGIQLTRQTGAGSDTGMSHSGQAKRRAGISSFRVRARVWEIPVFPCGKPE